MLPVGLGSNRESTVPDLNTAVTMSTTLSTLTKVCAIEARHA